jgi:oligoendopeptidase F
MTLLSSTSKKTRDSAVNAFNEILVENSDLAEHEINSILKCKQINDELRGLPRPDTARHLGDDVDTSVVDALIKVVISNFDIARRYYALKAKLFGVKKLEYHERNVPYGKLDKKYTYAEAKALVSKVLGNLDSEFQQIFQSFVNNNQIDVFPRKHKSSGACCAHDSVTQPTYILLNYGKTLSDVTTLAHETGHGINNELMRKKQNALNFDTPKSTAEVASTFMEDFVLCELEKEADEELKLAIMVKRLNSAVSSIPRQIACYAFEQELHKTFRKQGYLSKEEIGKLFQKHMVAYMGSAIEQSPGAENWWIYWSHIRAFFYVYSYSGGLLISKSLQSSVRKDPKFIEKVKEFLAAGTSDSPKNIFKALGIDITKASFWEQGMDEIRTLLNETEKLAKKLGKI